MNNVKPGMLNINDCIVNLPEGVPYTHENNHLQIDNGFGIVDIYVKGNQVEIYAKYKDLSKKSFLFENTDRCEIDFNYSSFVVTFNRRSLIYVDELKPVRTQKLEVYLLPLIPGDPGYHQHTTHYKVDMQKRIKNFKQSMRKKDKKPTQVNIFENMDADISMKTAFDIM